MQGFFNCIYYYQVAFCVVKELLQYETNGYIFYLYLFRKIEIIAKKAKANHIYINIYHCQKLQVIRYQLTGVSTGFEAAIQTDGFVYIDSEYICTELVK